MFNGIDKSLENYDSYTYKQNEVLMDEPMYLGFAMIELGKLQMYETYYDRLQQYFGQDKLQLHYMDCDSFILSMKTEKIIENLKNLEDIFDFGNLGKDDEIFSNESKKTIGKIKTNLKKFLEV